MLSLRLASAAVAIPLLLAIAYFGERGTIGGVVYGIAIVLATFVAALESRIMLRASGHVPLDPVLLGLSMFLPFHAWFLVPRHNGQPLFGTDGMVIVGIAVIVSLLLPMLRRHLENVILDWALSLSFALYLGGLMQFYAPLRDRPDGAFWVISAVGLSWVCDSTAYFVGRGLGRTRLAPTISPKKSVQGAVGGLVLTSAVASVWGLVTNHSPSLVAGFGAAIAVATIYGDLAESLLKRQTGVKDSGVLIPGHGGILDRMDSLLFCGPVAVLYLRVLA
jgi:phosphatidate cytidylyltransferase